MDKTQPETLKSLLSSWKLAELLPQLQDENIDIEELRMMKRHHLTELLSPHKLGLRIRFEYHLERWRREQNRPLCDIMTANHQLFTSTNPQVIKPTIIPAVAPQEIIVNHTKKLESRATNTVTVHYATVATNTSDMMIIKMPTKKNLSTSATLAATTPTTLTRKRAPTPTPTVTLPLTPPPQLNQAPQPSIQPQLSSQPSQKSQTAQLSQSQPLLPIQDVSVLREMLKPLRQPNNVLDENISNTCPAGRPTLKQPFPELNNDVEGEQTDVSPLMHILNSSGYKGQSLWEYYQEHKKFTNVHRTLLILLIVNFFDMNEYHLSLKVSHNLEQQILKLFPNEKLQYYRNEKRGRIYVKFCNRKRYKRDKPRLKRKCTESLDLGGDESGGGGDADGGGANDDVNMLPEPEVVFECGSDDVGDFAQHFEDWHAQQSPSCGVHVKTESLSDVDF